MAESSSQGPVSIEEAKSLDGLRVLLFKGLPSPWSQAAKGIFKIKGVSYIEVVKSSADADDAILQWTGQDSYPAVVYNQEKPCTSWLEILFLAERLGNGASLIPSDPNQRALMLGMSQEVFGQMGFCWCRRLMMFRRILSSSKTDDGMRAYVQVLANKYRYSEADAEQARLRVVDILDMLSQQLAAQHERGHHYFMGNELTALDIYWAVSALFLRPLSQEDCPLPPGMRESYELTEAELGMEVDEALLEHRDRIYKEYLGLPVQL